MAVAQFRPSTTLFGPVFDNFIAPARLAALPRAPEADVVETENDIRVMVEIPGFRPEDVNIEVEDNVLSVSGEKRAVQTKESKQYKWHLSERRFGRFARSFILPRGVEQDQIEAHCENGVLHITVPKSETARRRRIEVRGDQNTESHQLSA